MTKKTLSWGQQMMISIIEDKENDVLRREKKYGSFDNKVVLPWYGPVSRISSGESNLRDHSSRALHA